jgi:carbamate kinase
MTQKLAVIAFGGNALLKSHQKGSYTEQIENVTETCRCLTPMLKSGYRMVIGHGNGPQVGNVMLQHKAGKSMYDVEQMPLNFCVAETQGSIGALIEEGLRHIFAEEGWDRDTVTLLTHVEVDANDPLFQNPTKPVGPYCTKEEAEQYHAATGDVYREDPKGNGWRKVVASPKPLRIQNIKLVRRLAEEGIVVITVGGGGIPVALKDGYLKGVEAVIDKDLATAITAIQIQADEFYILTDVPKVYINFRKPDEKALDTITVAQAKQYLQEGQFTEGSMAPKIRAAIMFVEQTGNTCIITEAGKLGDPQCGTRIVK